MSSHSDKPPMSRDSDRPVLAPLQTNPVPAQESTSRMTMDFLPPFMLGKDIPDMSSVAQRVGAYQTRREQMVKTDTGLRGWLLQWSQSRPSSLPQRTQPLSSDVADCRTARLASSVKGVFRGSCVT
jgi:hypothetical protein